MINISYDNDNRTYELIFGEGDDSTKVSMSEKNYIELKKLFNVSLIDAHYGFHKPGVWLVSKEDTTEGNYLRAELIEELNDNPIKAYPFVNIEKYRELIETTLTKFIIENRTINIKKCTTQIVKSISDHIKDIRNNHIVTKDDFKI